MKGTEMPGGSQAVSLGGFSKCSREAAKQIFRYSSSLIIIGGFFSNQKYYDIQNVLERKILLYLDNHPEINSIIITPIEIKDLPEIKALHLQINDYWIENPNPTNQLSIVGKFKKLQGVRIVSSPILGDFHPFPTPMEQIDFIDHNRY